MTVGPPEHTALPFRLFYPAVGTVTDSVTLRAPNLGNKDRLSFNRILRETRGGTLVVFADPIWPKIQTLVLTFSGLPTSVLWPQNTILLVALLLAPLQAGWWAAIVLTAFVAHLLALTQAGVPPATLIFLFVSNAALAMLVRSGVTR